MTNEEAIREFKRILNDEINDSTLTDFRDFYYSAMDHIDRLKKQIPEKPKKIMSLKGETLHLCPQCFRECEVGDEGCQVCNQRLNWSL